MDEPNDLLDVIEQILNFLENQFRSKKIRIYLKLVRDFTKFV